MNGGTGEFWRTVGTTFLASIKSVGTACTLASVGIYLHQRGFVVGDGKRTLALISQQVTIPLLFFTKILYCNQDWSPEPCPNVTDSLEDVWILLVWPLWVCIVGICVGHVVVVMAGDSVKPHQRNSILASVAFGNSTGLPITLLTVIHTNFGPSSALGSVDPTLFLSVYLVMYPILQWGIGGMLLAPPATTTTKTTTTTSNARANPTPLPHDLSLLTKGSGASSLGDDSVDDADSSAIDCEMSVSFGSSIRRSITVEIDRTKQTLANTQKTLANNVIHNKTTMPETYQISHRGLDATDASMYWSVAENLNQWGKPQYGAAPAPQGLYKNALTTSSGNSIGMDLSDTESKSIHGQDTEDLPTGGGSGSGGTEDPNRTRDGGVSTETSALLGIGHDRNRDPDFDFGASKSSSSTSPSKPSSSGSSPGGREQHHLLATIRKILARCLQPPVVAALLGLLCASFPDIRGFLVDIDDRNGSAPLQWLFDGLFEAGRAAVPINMIILGCNLSASYMLHSPGNGQGNGTSYALSSSKEHESTIIDTKTTLLVVFGKMIAMPLVGYASTLVLSLFYTVPQDIAGSLYLVLSIVFLCPTANNVMVMVELSGKNPGAKESMARIIACQYAIAPLLLSGTVTGAVLMAASMAGQSPQIA